MASSHETPPASGNIDSVGAENLKLLGILKYATTVLVILEHISHICGDARRRNAKAKVRIKRSFGSSPSKPAPDIMLFIS